MQSQVKPLILIQIILLPKKKERFDVSITGLEGIEQYKKEKMILPNI
jgi:hypothetical protein